MTAARRSALGLNAHPLAAAWARDGVLALPFERYADPANASAVLSLLAMATASPTLAAAAADPGGSDLARRFYWARKELSHTPHDPQCEAHIDTFHPLVKCFVFEEVRALRTAGRAGGRAGGTVEPAVEPVVEPARAWESV